jgi:hypothetical protein
MFWEAQAGSLLAAPARGRAAAHADARGSNGSCGRHGDGRRNSAQQGADVTRLSLFEHATVPVLILRGRWLRLRCRVRSCAQEEWRSLSVDRAWIVAGPDQLLLWLRLRALRNDRWHRCRRVRAHRPRFLHGLGRDDRLRTCDDRSRRSWRARLDLPGRGGAWTGRSHSLGLGSDRRRVGGYGRLLLLD